VSQLAVKTNFTKRIALKDATFMIRLLVPVLILYLAGAYKIQQIPYLMHSTHAPSIYSLEQPAFQHVLLASQFESAIHSVVFLPAAPYLILTYLAV
jgi:hypothetical protein